MVLHGRFPPEMGARILGALDAAMQAHATEQPASGWDNEGSAPEDVPRWDVRPGFVVRRCNDQYPGSGNGVRPTAPGRPTVPDRRPTRDVHPWTVAHRAPRRPADVGGRADVRAWRCPGACTGPPRNRRPRRSRSARRRSSGTLRNPAPHGHRGRDRPTPVLRCRHRPRGGRCERRAAQRRAAHPQHPAGGATCIAQPRPRVPLSRLPRHAPTARSSRTALGQRR